MSNAANAIRFLESQTMTAHAAVARLCDTLGALTPLSLFQHYFPKEFATQRVSWQTGAGVREACTRFAELVDLRLFPCCSHWDIDEGWAEYSGDIVFLAPFPAWYDECRDPTELGRLEELVLLQLGYLERRGEEIEHVVDPARSKPINLEYLEQLCDRKRKPVCWLPLAVKFFLKTTRNTWCDITQEELDNCAEWPTWSLETTEWLRKEWAEAQVISSRVALVEEWLGQKPGNQQIIETLLRQATNLPKEKRQRVRVNTNAPLMNVMEEFFDE